MSQRQYAQQQYGQPNHYSQLHQQYHPQQHHPQQHHPQQQHPQHHHQLSQHQQWNPIQQPMGQPQRSGGYDQPHPQQHAVQHASQQHSAQQLSAQQHSAQQLTPQYRTPQPLTTHGLPPQQQPQHIMTGSQMQHQPLQPQQQQHHHHQQQHQQHQQHQQYQQQQHHLQQQQHQIQQQQLQQRQPQPQPPPPQQQFNHSATHSPMSHQSIQTPTPAKSPAPPPQPQPKPRPQPPTTHSQPRPHPDTMTAEENGGGARALRTVMMYSARSSNLIEDILGPVDLKELSPANQDFSHPVLTSSIPHDVLCDEDQSYLPGSRLPARHSWMKQTFFPKSTPTDQAPQSFNTGLYYSAGELASISPRFLDESSLSCDTRDPENTPKIPTLQSRSGNDARLPQYVLPEGHFPLQNQFTTFSNDNAAPTTSTISISPMHYTSRPNVTVPFQTEQSAGTMPIVEYKQPDYEATLLGQIGGMKPKPPDFSSFTAGSVLLDIPEAGRRSVFVNYEKLAISRLYYNNYLFGGSEDSGLTSADTRMLQLKGSPHSTSTTMDDNNAPEDTPPSLIGLPAPPLKHYFGPYDIIKRKVIHIGNDRQEFYLQAKLAETAERWGDMALACRQSVIHCNGRISREERSMFILAHKQLILPLRQAIRVCRQPFPTESQRDLATHFGAHLQYQLITLTKSLVQFTISILLRATLMTAENHIVFLKFCGDLYRYIAESSPNFFDAARLTRAYYHDAALLSERYLSISNPIRLGLLLNYSVAAFELFRDPKTACEMISWSFDKAINRMDELNQRDFNESIAILQLMRDNMLMWTAMLQGTALYLIENNSEAGVEAAQANYNNTQPIYTTNIEALSKYDQPLVEISSSLTNGQLLVNPINFPSAFDIQLAHSFPHRSPIELPINNKNSHMIPRSMHLTE